ncbi:transposase domain-containing protein [Streptomyces sp. BE303]|uniref:transposase domain-containing protein n=1 Tax=Streptomyces sp. BE303 TaxID=3002528 RepID=UPI002E75F70C|nr:transposase domain-containing protein [Streptomyces sp. BE303]MED7950434.1 transposase domain-containing protein [Streptomyces sp. BE303]
MCLFLGQGHEEVARLLGEGLGDGRRVWRVPTTAASGRARRRLGPEPLKVLFARVCRSVAVPGTAGAWYRRRQLVAVDGTTLGLAAWRTPRPATPSRPPGLHPGRDQDGGSRTVATGR